MFYCVAYDIRSNNLRLKVSKHCLRIGLVRVQKSVFMGRSLPRLMTGFEAEVRVLLPATDRFFLLPLDQPGFESLLFLGKTTDLAVLFMKKKAIRHF